MAEVIEKIVNKENLLHTASLLKRKRFKPGFDGMSITGANSWLAINGDRLCKDILRGDYQPLPAVGFRFAKHSGEFRRVSKLSAIDAIIQNTILNEITEIAEGLFSDNSHAYRQNRGVNSALEQYVVYANCHRYVCKFDFTACFDNIDHGILERSLHNFFKDDKLCDLIMQQVALPCYIDDQITPTTKGLLQGMPLAPLLCNVYMHSADTFLSQQGIAFIRYADDLVVFENDADKIKELRLKIGKFFEKELALKCNLKKTTVGSPASISFLGHKFTSDKKGYTAHLNKSSAQTYYNTWQSRSPFNNRRNIDLISDGILRQKNFSLLFDTDATDSVLPISTTDTINVYSDVIFDSGALKTAFKNGVTINIFDNYGSCIGSFEPNTALKAPKLNHEQLAAYYNEKSRIKLAKEFLIASIHNTNLVIRYYNKHRPHQTYEKALDTLAEIKLEIKRETKHEKLLLLEARAREAYYSCFDLFLEQSDFKYEKRTQRPPQNEVNALISFGNTLLYNYIATQIQKTPLDVRVGFLHATTKRQKTLNLDVAEIFKPLIVDRTIFSLINKRELEYDHFERNAGGATYLTAEGKRIFLRAFYKKLDSQITVNNETVTYRHVITDEVVKLVRHFRNSEKYKAYRQVR